MTPKLLLAGNRIVNLVFSEPDDDGKERHLYVSSVESVDEFPDVLGADGWPVAPHDGFALLVAGDLSGVGAAVIGDMARWCIEHGLFAVSVWGEDCERVHDIFDEVDVDLGAADAQPVVMTAWHAHESLPEAIDFFWDCSIADRGKAFGPSRIALVFGNSCSEADIAGWIARRADGSRSRIFRWRQAMSRRVRRPSPG